MIAATAKAGSKAMPKWLSNSRMGTAALRLPLIAPIRPGKTVLLTSLDTTCAKAGKGTMRSSADIGGAMLGLTLARITTYNTYKVANITPGKNAPAYSLTTDTPAVAPYTISMTEGGIKIPKQPPAVMAPADSCTL